MRGKPRRGRSTRRDGSWWCDGIRSRSSRCTTWATVGDWAPEIHPDTAVGWDAMRSHGFPSLRRLVCHGCVSPCTTHTQNQQHLVFELPEKVCLLANNYFRYWGQLCKECFVVGEQTVFVLRLFCNTPDTPTTLCWFCLVNTAPNEHANSLLRLLVRL